MIIEIQNIIIGIASDGIGQLHQGIVICINGIGIMHWALGYSHWAIAIGLPSLISISIETKMMLHVPRSVLKRNKIHNNLHCGSWHWALALGY